MAQRSPPLELIAERDCRLADERARLLAPLAEAPSCSVAAIDRVARLLNLRRASVYRLLRRLQQQLLAGEGAASLRELHRATAQLQQEEGGARNVTEDALFHTVLRQRALIEEAGQGSQQARRQAARKTPGNPLAGIE